MRTLDLPMWQVFLVRSQVNPSIGYEHVRLPILLLERARGAVIAQAPFAIYSHPVNAVRLASMEWVQLDGLLCIPEIDLRTHQNMYRKDALNKLKVVARQWGMDTPDFVPEAAPDGSLSPTGRIPARPSLPENFSKKEIEKLLKKPGPVKGPPPARSAVDVNCLIDKAALDLFAGTVVVRDVANSSIFGLRNQLRRAKARKES